MMNLWIELDGYSRRNRDRLMDGTALCNSDHALFLFRCHPMGKMNHEVNVTDSVRALGHVPFRIDRQSFA